MCSIFGAVTRPVASESELKRLNEALSTVWQRSHERGRDGRGFTLWETTGGEEVTQRNVTRAEYIWLTSIGDIPSVRSAGQYTMIGNMRAEPTTEYVKEKREADQQPYRAFDWSIVHNGTIANDRELRTNIVDTKIDSAAIAEALNGVRPTFDGFTSVIRKLKGSFAILAVNRDKPTSVFVAANYRPVWYAVGDLGVFFGSTRNVFPDGMVPRMLPPYSAAEFTAAGVVASASLLPPTAAPRRALVVCSGGLDSVVSATWARSMGYDIHLIHFLYGSRAEGPEVKAVKAVAGELGCPLTLFPLNVYSKGDSPLLDPDSKVAGGEEGAEFAHEWVPARNLLLLSVATAFAEARGIDTIVLGNNLEEAGAYPDNEPEFIARFNDLLPFAVGDGKRMQVIMPVGNMMKHEIVELGNRIKAPLHLTWSCYRAGELHCGTCGPCYMRRKAFAINKLPEVIKYADEDNA